MEQFRIDLNGLEFGHTGLLIYLSKADYIYTKDVKFFLNKGATQSSIYIKRLLIENVAETVGFRGRKFIRLKDDYLKKNKIDRDPAFFLHNLTATSFLAGIKRVCPDYKIYWGKENKDFQTEKSEGKIKVFPDVFFYDDTDNCYAVEIELTQKTERRIIQKIENYIERNDDYFKVVYLFTSSHLKEKFVHLIQGLEQKYIKRGETHHLNKLKDFFILIETPKIETLAERIHLLSCVTPRDWINENFLQIITMQTISGGKHGNGKNNEQ